MTRSVAIGTTIDIDRGGEFPLDCYNSFTFAGWMITVRSRCQLDSCSSFTLARSLQFINAIHRLANLTCRRHETYIAIHTFVREFIPKTAVLGLGNTA
jgi:hypothetical protein